nr:hypothetical protein [uncultured Mediterranean phage uvMED]
MMIVRMMNKQLQKIMIYLEEMEINMKIGKKLSKKENLEELMRLTLINILNAKGVIYTYYKQQQERENNVNRQAHNKNNWIKIRS